MRATHDIILMKVWPSVARLSAAAPGAISISLVALTLLLAMVIINMAYRWFIARASQR
jgi:hypothetical protein